MTLQALIEPLLQPAAYPDRPSQVPLRQTHISWVFLTDRFVYNIKKPVAFGFLDFTTLQARRFFCHEEVRLNRRLAPQVYLGVTVSVGARRAVLGAAYRYCQLEGRYAEALRRPWLLVTCGRRRRRGALSTRRARAAVMATGQRRGTCRPALLGRFTT